MSAEQVLPGEQSGPPSAAPSATSVAEETRSATLAGKFVPGGF